MSPPESPARAAGEAIRGRRRRSKSSYLDLAVGLANEYHALGVTPHAYAVAHVDIARVAEVSCVSRTALYRLWETQESFRAELAAYLAARDEAPWMERSGRRLGGALTYPDELFELIRQRLNADQDSLATDPRPLLRAGVAGYPVANPVTAVIAERELCRLSHHAEVVSRALRSTGRRCRDGLVPTDISVVTTCMADGLALAARMTPPRLRFTVAAETERPWSLFALAVSALFDGMTEPDPEGVTPTGAGSPDLNAAALPIDQAIGGAPRGRRLDYLRAAAELASAEPPEDELRDGYAVGYVGLDSLARAGGVTRAAVRKLWPTQAAFRLDLFVHLLSRHRHMVSERFRQAALALSGEARGQHLRARDNPERSRLQHALLRAGDELFAQLCDERSRVSHLTFAPQFVFPSFRSHIHQHVDPLLASTAAHLTELLSAIGRRLRPGLTGIQAAILAHSLIDGMTRVGRTIPEVTQRPVPYEGGFHSLLGAAMADLFWGLSEEFHSVTGQEYRAVINSI